MIDVYFVLSLRRTTGRFSVAMVGTNLTDLTLKRKKFMVDSANIAQVSSSCIQLLSVLSAEPLHSASVLILFNKSDVPCTMSLTEMKSLFRMDDIIASATQPITTLEISARTGQGLQEVLSWLESIILVLIGKGSDCSVQSVIPECWLRRRATRAQGGSLAGPGQAGWGKAHTRFAALRSETLFGWPSQRPAAGGSHGGGGLLEVGGTIHEESPLEATYDPQTDIQGQLQLQLLLSTGRGPSLLQVRSEARRGGYRERGRAEGTGAFAGIACHGLPYSACTENNGKPVWRVRVVEGKRNGWVGVGPTLLPQILWIGFWSRFGEGGGVGLFLIPQQSHQLLGLLSDIDALVTSIPIYVLEVSQCLDGVYVLLALPSHTL
ncbi:hypothetical protein INR49_028103 [Caranx melampygus]|nr:hypothetical protein INR49_028103 [Caranx melampygus]